MSGAPPLPPCPVCGKEPLSYSAHQPYIRRFVVQCVGARHDMMVDAGTRVAAHALWRRVAGGRK